MKRIDNIETWRFFVEIVQAGGLNSACAKLALEPSTVSRAIRALEKEIGAPLFSRATRPACLTQLGQASYERALILLREHDALSRFLTQDREAMAGTIRVGAHVGVSATTLTELILDFMAIYPEIHFEIKDQALSTEDELSPTNPDGVDVLGGEAVPRHEFGERPQLGEENLLRVVLHPAGPRVNLLERPLGDVHPAADAVDERRARGRGPLVECNDIAPARAHAAPPVCLTQVSISLPTCDFTVR